MDLTFVNIVPKITDISPTMSVYDLCGRQSAMGRLSQFSSTISVTNTVTLEDETNPDVDGFATTN